MPAASSAGETGVLWKVVWEGCLSAARSRPSWLWTVPLPMSCTWGTRGIVLRSGWRMDFAVVSVLLLPCPYDSDAGSNACGTGTGVSAYLASGDGGTQVPHATSLSVRTFVNAYCCSGDSFTFRKRRASYWKRIRSENVPEFDFLFPRGEVGSKGSAQYGTVPCRAAGEFQQSRK